MEKNIKTVDFKIGRPRSSRERYPCGQVKPEPLITETALHRLRTLGTYPVLETQVGRLLFLGALSIIEAETAWRIAVIYGRFERAIGARLIPSASYEAGRARDTAGFESIAEADRARSAIRRFEALQEAIAAASGHSRITRLCLEELCIHDHVITVQSLVTVK